MKRRTFVKSAAAGLPILSACASRPEAESAAASVERTDGKYKLYWGDLHTHCNITYGHGDMRDALEAAVEQLDFCSVVAHALWPDIPGRNDPRLSWVIDYHLEAFERLRGNWKNVQDLNLEYHKPGEFLTILGYECHCMEHGDHNVYNLDPRAPIVEAEGIPDLKDKLRDSEALVIPHHMGYINGYRGFNWDSFTGGAQEPFVEIYSRHGCSETDIAPYPMLHDMGPRSHEGTAEEGLRRGHRFGMMASTDQHGGYPGSYGDGRVAVYARELTTESLWEAFRERRVYGTTGEKIALDFQVNGALMGSETAGGGRREIYLRVEGNDFVDYADIVSNGRVIERISAPWLPGAPAGDPVRAKVRIEWGWNREEGYTEWEGRLRLSDGRLLEATPCFRGLPVTSPQKGLDHETKVSRVLERDGQSCAFHSFTSKNPNTVTPTTDSMVLDVLMPRGATIIAEVNGERYEHTLDELFGGARSHFLVGWLSEAISFHRAVPEAGFLLERSLTDEAAGNGPDYYYLRVRQHNGQWAWSSPVWVEA